MTIAVGTILVPGTPLPTDINAALAQTQANLDAIYPSNPSTEDYPLPQSCRNYLAKATVAQVNDGIITATGAWAAPSNDRNVNNSTRHAVWTSNHGTVETNVLDNYFLHGKAWPTNEVIKSVITGSASGTVPAVPAPAPLPSNATNVQITAQVNANTSAIASLKGTGSARTPSVDELGAVDTRVMDLTARVTTLEKQMAGLQTWAKTPPAV